MVDRLEQKERYDRELNVVKRARFNQTIKPYQTNEVPEPKFGVEPHTVKELPALPVRERRQDNMLQRNQDNMLEDGEVVSFGQWAQQQDQQQLQLRQHNIPHNPVYPEQTREGTCLQWTFSPGTVYAWVLQVNHSWLEVVWVIEPELPQCTHYWILTESSSYMEFIELMKKSWWIHLRETSGTLNLPYLMPAFKDQLVRSLRWY